MADPDSNRLMGDLVREGTIVSVDHAAGTCRVQLADELETGDIPWVGSRLGKTRSWSPPSIGEQVIVLSPEGDTERAFVAGSLSSDAHPHAGNDSSTVFEFEDGARLRYDPVAHALEALLPAAGTAIIVAQGGITLRGDVTVEGKVTASDDIIAAGISLKEHKHGGVRAGSDQSGAPA